MEVSPGFEPGVKELQSYALPLGYDTTLYRLHYFTTDSNIIHEKIRFVKTYFSIRERISDELNL